MDFTQLLSLFSYVTVLVLCERQVSHTGNKTVQCAKTKVKVHDRCVSQASLCQAVETLPLALTCSPCDDKDVVMWFFSPGSQREHFNRLSQETKTLLLPAVNVTKNASGCYQCQCGNGEVKLKTNFSVQVDQPGPPTFLVRANEDQSPTDFELFPSPIDVSLDETSPGVVCINCSATGYPDLQYKWSYRAFSGEWKNMSSDPCLGFYNNQPEVLCFTPTIQNVLQQLDFRCEVSNIVQTVTAEQSISYPAFAKSSDWFVRPHLMQSQGAITLTEGTATANCAAYQQTGLLVPFEYYVCALPDTADAALSACLFNSLTCCSCHDESCPLGINVTCDKFTDSVGIVTDGCRVDSTVEGNFVCIVQKNVSRYSAKQYIGTISFEQEMQDSPTLTPWGLGLASGAGGVILTALVLISSLVCIVGVCYIRPRRGGAFELRIDEDEQAQGGEQRRLLEGNPGRQPEMPPTTMTVAWESLEVIANQEESETVVSQWNLRSDGSLELPASPMPGANFFLQVRASNGTCVRIPVATAACVSEDPSVPTPSASRVPDTTVITRRDLTDSVRRGEALYHQVQKMQSALLSDMHLDANLLAKLNERGLLTPEEYNDINAHILGNNIHAAGTHFVNSVVIRWPYGVYEGNVCKLIEALESHSDQGNNHLARKLRESFSECALDFPCAGDGTDTH